MEIWMDVDAALSEVPVNSMPLIDDTDFKTIEDAVAYNAAGMALFWHFVTTAGAYTVTAVTPTTGGTYDWTDQGTAGVYTIEIPASGGASINNDTEGFGWFTGKATGVLPWKGPIIGFRAAALNDALIDGGDLLDVNLAQILGTALTETAGLLAAGFKQFFNIASPTSTMNTITTVTTATNLTTNNDKTGYGLSAAAVQAIWDALTSALTTANSIGKRIVDFLTGDAFARIGSNGAGLTAVPWNASWDAEVQSEVADALDSAVPGSPTANSINERIKTLDDAYTATRAGYLDNLSAGAVALASNLATLAGKFTGITLLAEWLGLIAGKQVGNSTARTELRATGAGSGTYDETTESLEALKDGSADVTDIEDAVLDALLADHADAGSVGEGIANASSAGDPWGTVLPGAYGAGTAGKILGDNLNATVSSRLPTANITLSSGKVTVGTNDDKTGYGLSAAAVQAIWDALTSALTTVGSIGKWIVDKVDVVLSTRLASSSYTAPLDAAGTRTAVGLGSANLDTQLDALPTAAENRSEMDSNSTKLAAIDAKTTNLPSDPADASVVAGLIGGLNNIAAADVLTQVNAALDAANTEVTSVPTSTTSLRNMIKYVFAWRRNKKLQTATTMTLRNNADSADIAASTVGDDGTTLTIGKDT